MPFTTYWSPNQATIAQVETVTLVGAPTTGNTFSATINGKTVTYTALSTDTTAALFAAGLFNLLNQSTSVPAELTELTFSNPNSGNDGVITATAQTPGTPFANVTVNGVPNQGLVFSTGNGYGGTCTTTHTQPNTSLSDVYDPQNWSRVNTSTSPPTQTRALPQNGDNVIVARTSVPMLWNLDRLVAVQFATYQRWTSMTGQIGLPATNANGYAEWRAQYFQFAGPQGSVPAGGLTIVLGQVDSAFDGSGPALERYDLGSQRATLTILSGGQVDFLGIHTMNTFTVVGATLNVAATPGEVATLNTSFVNTGARLNVGLGVTWTSGSTLSVSGSSAVLNAAPPFLTASNGSQVLVTTDQLTWTSITAQGGCTITFLAGGTITTLTMTNGCALDKSSDARALTITNLTIDGDTCQILDPLNAVTFTNPTTVNQQVSSGPFTFTGPRTMRVV